MKSSTMRVHVTCPSLLLIVYCYLKFKVSLWPVRQIIVAVLLLFILRVIIFCLCFFASLGETSLMGSAERKKQKKKRSKCTRKNKQVLKKNSIFIH